VIDHYHALKLGVSSARNPSLGSGFDYYTAGGNSGGNTGTPSGTYGSETKPCNFSVYYYIRYL
jgi:hypothetical protein